MSTEQPMGLQLAFRAANGCAAGPRYTVTALTVAELSPVQEPQGLEGQCQLE